MKSTILSLWMFVFMFLSFSCKKGAQITQAQDNQAKSLAVLATNSLGGRSLDVPLGGNGFITYDTGGGELIDSTGLHNWTSSSTVTSTYFRIGITGKLTVALKAIVAPSGSSTIKVTVNGTVFTKTITGNTYRTTTIGTINITAPGYIKVDIQGVSKTGSYYGDVSDLIISGTAVASGVQYANDPTNFYWSRRGPSLHLSFTAPANSEWLYSEVTVPVGQDPIGSYFEANGFSEGYFGMQVNSSTERRMLFSVWNPTGGTTTFTRKGPNVVAQNFTGEGSGGQAYLVYNWQAGNTYKFLTQAYPDGSGNTIYSSWFFAPELGTWTFIATWLRPNTTTYLTGLYSFLENFNDTNGYFGRQAQYGNEWVYSSTGTWTELTSAYYDGDATANNQQRIDYAGGVQNGKFYLQNGGFFSNYVNLNQTFTRSGTGTPPSINFTTLP
jgi:hypothetical protein